MRNCKICNSKMYLKVSTKGLYIDKYFWGCSSFPECRNIENTILRKQNFRTYYLGNDSANSMKILRPFDNVPDTERHYAIYKQFEYDYKVNQSDFENLDLLLGFENSQDFFFWVATQQKIISQSVHNYLPVGSPYYSTFRNLTVAINLSFDNVISTIKANQSEIIESSIKVWTDFFQKRAEEKLNRIRVSEEKIQAEHELSLKRKADKASIDIFNAIRRKDLNAIVSLRQKGADLNSTNEVGLNCLDYAKTFNDDKLIVALTCNLTELN